MKNVNEFLIICLLMMTGIFTGCAKNKNNSYIIFWDYAPDISIEYLNNVTISECLKKHKSFIKLDFDEFKDFNPDSTTFTFKEDFDGEKSRPFDLQFEKSKEGLLFFSIVVDGQIIVNGLNRIPLDFLMPWNSYEINQNRLLIIYAIEKNYLRISYKYNFEDDYKNTCLREEDAALIESKFK